MIVRIRYKTGTVRNVPAYVGKRLVERRIAEYITEHTPAWQAAGGQNPEPIAPPELPAMPDEPELNLDAMTRDQLYDIAVERGHNPHPQLGAAKLRALLK